MQSSSFCVDPILTMFPEWAAAYAAYQGAVERYQELESRFGPLSPETDAYNREAVNPAARQEEELHLRIAEMVPTTIEGLTAQLRVAAAVVDPYEIEGVFLRSSLEAAERLSR